MCKHVQGIGYTRQWWGIEKPVFGRAFFYWTGQSPLLSPSAPTSGRCWAGIIETNRELTARFAHDYKINPNLFYASLEELLAKSNMQAAAKSARTGKRIDLPAKP